MREKILKDIQDHLRNELGIDPIEVTEESHLHNNLELDSLDDINLFMKMEAIHEITIPDEDMYEIHTVRDLIDKIIKIKGQ